MKYKINIDTCLYVFGRYIIRFLYKRVDPYANERLINMY